MTTSRDELQKLIVHLKADFIFHKGPKQNDNLMTDSSKFRYKDPEISKRGDAVAVEAVYASKEAKPGNLGTEILSGIKGRRPGRRTGVSPQKLKAFRKMCKMWSNLTTKLKNLTVSTNSTFISLALLSFQL